MKELIESLNALNAMKDIYEEKVHLCGNYYQDMMNVLNEQIEEVKKEIENRNDE